MGERTFWGLKIDKKFSPKISLIYAMLEQDRRLVKDKVRKLQPAHLLWRSDKKPIPSEPCCYTSPKLNCGGCRK